MLPKDAIWVRDVTQSNTTWGNRVFPLYAPHQNVYPVGAGIGQGLCPGDRRGRRGRRPQDLVMTGDGGFFLNVGELWTAVQENLDLVVMVMNDRGYGVIKRIQDATAEGRRFFADLQSPDLAAAGGTWPAFRISAASQRRNVRRPRSRRHWRIKGLTMVEVDMAAVGEFPAYFPFNQRRQDDARCGAVAGAAGGRQKEFHTERHGVHGEPRRLVVPPWLSVGPPCLCRRFLVCCELRWRTCRFSWPGLCPRREPYSVAHRGRRRGAADRSGAAADPFSAGDWRVCC